MLNKQIIILVSLALLAIFTLAEDWSPDLRAIWEGDGSVNMFGAHIDIATECDGQPCNYPPLVKRVPSQPSEFLGYCEDNEPCPGSGIFSMSDEEWEENFGDEEKDAAFEKKTGGGWCATAAQDRRLIREEKRRAKQIDQNNN